jgi:tellurite resistance protein TerC
MTHDRAGRARQPADGRRARGPSGRARRRRDADVPPAGASEERAVGFDSSGTIALWIIFGVVVLASLFVDLGLHRDRHQMSTKESAIWAGVWIALAVVFGVAVSPVIGTPKTIDYFTAYILEKSLSVDNLFVFLVVFAFFKIPPELQHRVLFWGILGALVMRAVFILLGVALLARFHFLFYIFGAFLVYTGVKLLTSKGQEVHPEDNWASRAFRRFFPITDDISSGNFFVVEDGKRKATRLMVALVVIEATDLVFAIDSIPAVLAVTTDPFVVYTSNIFAILGLRALYFLLAGVMTKFRYLNYGLAIVLAFIGVKMIIVDWVPIPALVSLSVVGGVLALAIAVSIWSDIRDRRRLARIAEGAQETAEP